MFLSRRLSVSSLVDLCRSLRCSLTSGLMLRDTMELLAAKGIRPVRPVAGKIARDLRAGWALQDALKKQEVVFPPLFLALAVVGEESGNLPEVMAELEKYYILQQRLRRDFLSEITWPIVQLTAAILVIAALIYILGIIAVAQGPHVAPIDPLGLGLVGPQGSLVFLTVVSGTLLSLLTVYWLTKRLLRRRAWVEWLLLYVPCLGPCLRALALTRFCIALHLMMETSISVVKMLRLAFLATDNAAFIVAAPKVEASLRRGNTIATSLASAGVFPESFINVVAVAEESGRLPETFHHQAEQFDDEVKRRLAILNKFASGFVWLVVASFIVWTVFRIFTVVYLKNIEKYLPN
jgi:type IV pilus assembly protein PilC